MVLGPADSTRLLVEVSSTGPGFQTTTACCFLQQREEPSGHDNGLFSIVQELFGTHVTLWHTLVVRSWTSRAEQQGAALTALETPVGNTAYLKSTP